MAKDPHLYRITYNNGLVKIGFRGRLGSILAAMRHNWGYKTPVKIERNLLVPVWEDVIEEFILTGESDAS